MGASPEGSWETTRSIGRECTAGDRRSRPVLTAERLTTPIRRPQDECGGPSGAHLRSSIPKTRR